MSEIQSAEGNPLKAGEITVYSDCFSYKNRFIGFNEIKHISFYWEEIHGAYNQKKMELTVFLDKADEKIETKGKYFFSNSKKYDEFFKGYLFLLKKSFEKRYGFYFNQLEKNGYFLYDKKKFFRDGNVEWVDLKLDLKNCKIRINPTDFRIYYNESFMDMVKRFLLHPLSYNYIIVSTLMDRDVLGSLLKNLYNLSLTEKQ